MIARSANTLLVGRSGLGRSCETIHENWEFDDDGLMRRREASINDYAIEDSERKFHWPLGPRSADAPGLEEHVK